MADGGSRRGPHEPRNQPRRTVHGRRHGRRLRSGLSTLLKEYLPRLRIDLPAPGRQIDPEALFGREPVDIWLEIGFGAGEHLAWQAERHPDIGLIGAEFFINGIAALIREIDQRDLANIRILEGDGRDLLDALPARSLSRVFILFPDPWGKARHGKRRLIQGPTLDRLAVLMKDGAELRLATDHAGYLRWMLAEMSRHRDFEWLARGPGDWRERPSDWPASRYELKALGAGRKATYLRYVRCPRDLV